MANGTGFVTALREAANNARGVGQNASASDLSGIAEQLFEISKFISDVADLVQNYIEDEAASPDKLAELRSFIELGTEKAISTALGAGFVGVVGGTAAVAGFGGIVSVVVGDLVFGSIAEDITKLLASRGLVLVPKIGDWSEEEGRIEIIGSVLNDNVVSGAGTSNIKTGFFNDTVLLVGKRNNVETGSGSDRVEIRNSESYNDINTGSGSDEVLVQSGGESLISLGSGSDIVHVFKSGKNIIDGGGGFDTVVYQDGPISLEVVGGVAADNTTRLLGPVRLCR